MGNTVCSQENDVGICERPCMSQPDLNMAPRQKRFMTEHDSDDEVVATGSIDNQLMFQHESKIVFKQRFEINESKFLSFSQRRFLGFREHFEFDKKRLLIGNGSCLKVLAYSPMKIAQAQAKQANQQRSKFATNDDNGIQGLNHDQIDNPSILCCGPHLVNQNDKNGGFDSIDDLDDSTQEKTNSLDDEKIQQITELKLDVNSSEQIVFASFLEDINPNYLLIVTVDVVLCSSFISLGKIMPVKTRLSKKDQLYLAKTKVLENRHLVSEDDYSELKYKKKIAKKINNDPKHYVLNRKEGSENLQLKLTTDNLLKIEESTVFSQSERSEYTGNDEEYKNRRNSSVSPDRAVDTEEPEGKFPYVTKVQKVAIFTDHLFSKAFFSNSNIYGRMLFTVSQNGQVMMHRVKDIQSCENDYHIPNCKVLKLYLPRDFITTRSLVFGAKDKQRQNDPKSDNSQVKLIELYADYILILYKNKLHIDLFKKNGSLIERKTLSLPNRKDMFINTIDFVIFPRLEWSDRYFDIVQQSKNVIPRKLIVAGSAKRRSLLQPDSESEESFSNKTSSVHSSQNLEDQIYPFVLIYDRVKNQAIRVKIIHEIGVQLTCLKYGPYDNGHICIGLSNGYVVIFNSISLVKMYETKIFKHPVQNITFEPTNLLIVTSSRGDTAAVSLIENKVKYTYLEMGKDKYCTVQRPLTSKYPSSNANNVHANGLMTTR